MNLESLIALREMGGGGEQAQASILLSGWNSRALCRAQADPTEQ